MEKICSGNVALFFFPFPLFAVLPFPHSVIYYTVNMQLLVISFTEIME